MLTCWLAYYKQLYTQIHVLNYIQLSISWYFSRSLLFCHTMRFGCIVLYIICTINLKTCFLYRPMRTPVHSSQWWQQKRMRVCIQWIWNLNTFNYIRIYIYTHSRYVCIHTTNTLIRTGEQIAVYNIYGSELLRRVTYLIYIRKCVTIMLNYFCVCVCMWVYFCFWIQIPLTVIYTHMYMK